MLNSINEGGSCITCWQEQHKYQQGRGFKMRDLDHFAQDFKCEMRPFIYS